MPNQILSTLYSEEIEKNAKSIGFYSAVLRKEEIFGTLFKSIAANAGGYRQSIFIGPKRKWYGCTCDGWYYKRRCKHLYRVIYDAKKKEGSRL